MKSVKLINDELVKSNVVSYGKKAQWTTVAFFLFVDGEACSKQVETSDDVAATSGDEDCRLFKLYTLALHTNAILSRSNDILTT